MSSFSEQPGDGHPAPHAKVRLPARTATNARFTVDSERSQGNQVTIDITNDLSAIGLTGADIGDLKVGAVVRAQIPLIGWCNAEVDRIREGRAGCRFVVALDEDALRAAIAASPVVNANFPGLVSQVSPRIAIPPAAGTPDAPITEASGSSAY